MSAKILLQTDRLNIREFTLDDVDDQLALNSDPLVLKHIDPSRTTSREQEIESINKLQQEYLDTPGLGVWALETKADEKFSGIILLRTLYETGEHEVGFRVCPPLWGQGYATEAVAAMLKYGFETVKADVIVGLAMPPNLASRRVLEKVGMRYMGERTLPECADTWPELSHYRMDAAGWKAGSGLAASS